MRPKDLPFTIHGFDTRSPSYKDGVLTIPSFYEEHSIEKFPTLKKRLEEAKILHVEICSGNGEWITDRAQKNPHIFYVAVEKKFMRVRKIWSKMKNRDLNNLLIVSGMGEDFFDHYLEKHSVDEIFINFPDPWPKKRHAKHRIIKDAFLPPISSILKPHGTITITTDSKEYSDEIIEVFGKSNAFNNLYKEEGFAILDEEYGGSYFRRLWEEEGRTNRLMSFENVEQEQCELQKT